MHIYPAIDLKDGQGVRLLHGDFKRMTVYAPDPRAQAEKFIDAGWCFKRANGQSPSGDRNLPNRR
jgi:phosphoribosylformimino-5-aminoimidazole carboxamide ribotide isomerase